MNLILIKPEELVDNDGKKNVITLDVQDARTKHILGHLRKSPGGQVLIGIIGGGKGSAAVFPNDDGSLKLEIEKGTLLQSPESLDNRMPEVTVLLAICFPKRLKALWPMIASFGYVRRIIIVRGQLSDTDFCKSSTLRPDVYGPLIEEGMSQGGHTQPIQVDIVTENVISRETLDQLLGASGYEHNDATAKVFLDCEGAQLVPARDVVVAAANKDNQHHSLSAIVAIGPERGWTEEEVTIFKHRGFTASTLGLNNRFRVDTAVVAGLAIVSAALEEITFLKQQKHTVDNKKKQKLEIAS